MPFRIDCPHCEKRLRVPTKFAGKPSKCPACAKGISFPPIAKAIPEDELEPSQIVTAVEVTSMQSEPTIMVVERESASNRFSKKQRSIFPTISLLLAVFAVGFTAGQFFAYKKLEPLLPAGTKLQLGLALPFTDGNKSKPDVPGKQDFPAKAAQTPPRQPAKKLSPTQQQKQLSGPITEQKPVPLIANSPQDVERSGWGDAFDLLSVNAEPTTVIDGELVYNWYVEIKSKRDRQTIVYVSVRLMNDEDEMVGKSSDIKTTIAALTTKKVRGQLGIPPELEHKVTLVHANVRHR